MATVEPTGIAVLGLDAKALLFQTINFLILLVILRWVAYKPILKLLEQRRKQVEESLDKALEIEQSHLDLQEQTKKILRQTHDKATAIIHQARQAGEETKNKLLEEGKRQQQIILEQTAKQIESEKQKMITQAKQELKYLVIAAAQKIVSEKLDDQSNEKIIQKVLKDTQ